MSRQQVVDSHPGQISEVQGRNQTHFSDYSFGARQARTQGLINDSSRVVETNKFVEQGLLPSCFVAQAIGQDKAQAIQQPASPVESSQGAEPYLNGYSYSKNEAARHLQDLCQKGEWSESQIQFIRAYNAKIKEETNETFRSAESTNGQTSGNKDKSETTKTERKPFELGAEAKAEEVIWAEWQKRLNRVIFEKLEKLTAGQNLPPDLHAHVEYCVSPDGSFRWRMTQSCGNAAYDRIVQRSIDETLRFHPELRLFPQGAKREPHTRTASYSTGTESGYSTGPTPAEIRVRF